MYPLRQEQLERKGIRGGHSRQHSLCPDEGAARVPSERRRFGHFGAPPRLPPLPERFVLGELKGRHGRRNARQGLRGGVVWSGEFKAYSG
eukprot:9504017-Pyramimonas_sp.AAC.5